MSGFGPERPRSASLGEYYSSEGTSKSDLLRESSPGDGHGGNVFRPMDLANTPHSRDQTQELHRKVSHLTRTMHHNLQYVSQRGADLQRLENQVGQLELGSKMFNRSSSVVDKKLWWEERNGMFIALAGLGVIVSLVIVYLFIRKLVFG